MYDSIRSVCRTVAFAAPLMLAGAVTGDALAEDDATSEVHGSWRVVCVTGSEGKRCNLSQVQTEPESGQRLLAVELRPGEADTVSGMLALPFGLALGQGVRVAVDDAEPGQAQGFVTCLPDGCLVPLSFNAGTVEALRKGRTLRIFATAFSDGQRMLFQVPLDGFTAALARAANP